MWGMNSQPKTQKPHGTHATPQPIESMFGMFKLLIFCVKRPLATNNLFSQSFKRSYET